MPDIIKVYNLSFMFFNFSAIIMTYIKPEETIILNVLSAPVNFSLYGSLKLSRLADTTWKRTLSVVTKYDQDPDAYTRKLHQINFI